MKNIKAVLFDLDETLGDRKKSIHKYADMFIKKHCDQIDENEYKRRIDYFIMLDGNGYSNKHNMYDKLIVEWQLSDDLTPKILIDEWIIEFFKCYTLFDNAKDILVNLKTKYKLGLLTNGGSQSQRNKIRVTGIEEYFDAIIVSGEVGIKKPEKEVFNLLCNELDVDLSECIFIGDKYSTDIIGAINSNITAVWVNDEFKGDVQKEEFGYQISNIDYLHLIMDEK